MKWVVWALLAALIVLHQLDLAGNSTTLIAGTLPLPLVYHAGLCVAASVVWFLATKYAWPVDDEPAGEEFDA